MPKSKRNQPFVAQSAPASALPAAVPSDAAIVALRGTLDSLRADLTRVADRLADTTWVQSARRETVDGVRQEVADAVAAAQSAFTSSAANLSVAQDARLALLDGVVADVRQRLTDGDARLSALDARVTDARVEELVREAVRARADEVFTGKFQPGLDRLGDAYDQADDTMVRLKAYVDSFVPGGMPIARQTISALEAQRDALESESGVLRKRVAELEAAAIRQRVQLGVDPAVVDKRLQDLEARDRNLADRESLSSENARLARQIDTLLAEVQKWRGMSLAEQGARADKAELSRLHAQVTEAHDAMARAEHGRQRAERSDQQRAREVEALQVTLTGLHDQHAAAEQRDQRLEALTSENQQLARQYEDAAREASELRGDLRAAEGKTATLERTLLQRESTARNLEVEWRRTYAEQQRVELEKLRAELTTWAETTAVARTTAIRAESERLATELTARQARLETESKARALAETTRDQALAEKARLATEIASITAGADRHKAMLDEETRLQRVRLEERLRLDAEGQRNVLVAQGKQMKDVAEKDAAETRELADAYAARVEALELSRSELNGTIEGLTATRTTLEAELQRLKGEIDDLRVRVVPAEERVAQLNQKWSDETRPVESPDEEAWLARLEAGIRGAGFTFHPRLVRAFHTSLKIAHYAPLTVLAGISGTGKSELPRLYADLGGVPFLELAVQPSWDSPNDLFGFFNYTDGRLRAEPLARLLRQLQNAEDPLGQSPVIVLLDEMNLARVEYYFAELLSKLEARRSVGRFADDTARRAASVTMDAGPGMPGIDLFLDPRVMFVGTMNQDESTLTLSDKVLDRSCLLTFPAPRSLQMTEQNRIDRPASRLSHETWTSWIKPAPASQDDLTERLNNVNGIMAELDRPFGHRLFRAIHAYLANYPAPSGNEAWSDQFAMKVLPRLRGLECGDRDVRRSLDALSSLLPDELQEAFTTARKREFFVWAGASAIYQSDRA